MLANGNANQTTGRLFTTLARRLSERNQVQLRLRQFPRGVFRKLPALLRTELANCQSVLKSDRLIVHSSLSLSFLTMVVARCTGRPVIAFIWDFYPESSQQYGSLRNPLLILLYRMSERFAYRMCERIFVPSADYARFPALKGFRGIEVMPLWPCDPLLEPVRRKPSDRTLRIVFAGQINLIRGLPQSIERLARSWRSQVWIEIFSTSPPGEELGRAAERCANLRLVHHGFVPPDELPRRLRNSLFGLVSLDRSFSLPAFPSKILTYLAAGIPVIYDGPRMPALETALYDAGVGLSLADLTAFDEDALDTFLAEFPAARNAFIASIGARLERIEKTIRIPTDRD